MPSNCFMGGVTNTEGIYEMTITADTVLAEVNTLAEAKAIARDLRHTARVVSDKYGVGHPTTVTFDNRYWDFVDAMAERFA